MPRCEGSFLFAALLGAVGACDEPEDRPLVGPPVRAAIHRPADAHDAPDMPPVDRFGALQVRGRQIVSAEGLPVQLRGVSTQWLNWEQDYAASPDALAWLRDDWGLSVLRVANGVGYTNGYLTDPESRLALVSRIVENAIRAGIYVIVDWHAHDLRHRDEAMAFFATIAERYGDSPHVIYEVFNEPTLLDWSDDLRPYHEALIDTIRAYDSDNLIVVGTPRWDQQPDLAATAPLDDPHVVYALHFYACTHGAEVRAAGQRAVDAGLPLLVTEWGATPAEGGFVLRWMCEAETRTWHRWLDHHGIGWVAWKLSADLDLAGMLARGASTRGGWGPTELKGHGPLVRELLRDGTGARAR